MAWEGTAGANEVGTAVVTEPACCSIYMMCLEEQSFPQFGHAINKTGWIEHRKDGKKLDRWETYNILYKCSGIET
jgi:hypothetical protein